MDATARSRPRLFHGQCLQRGAALVNQAGSGQAQVSGGLMAEGGAGQARGAAFRVERAGACVSVPRAHAPARVQRAAPQGR